MCVKAWPSTQNDRGKFWLDLSKGCNPCTTVLPGPDLQRPCPEALLYFRSDIYHGFIAAASSNYTSCRKPALFKAQRNFDLRCEFQDSKHSFENALRDDTES
jgi:hypothetical protein